MWNGYLQMTGIDMITHLKPARAGAATVEHDIDPTAGPGGRAARLAAAPARPLDRRQETACAATSLRKLFVYA